MPQIYADYHVTLPPTGLFINNTFTESVSGGTFPTFYPATGETIAHVASATAADVDRAVQSGAFGV